MASSVAMFNSSGQFLQWITKRRAITLIVAEEAYSVSDSQEVWRSPSTSINVPRGIVLLSRAQKFFQEEITFTRAKMFKRDNYTCQYCGAKGPGVELTKDHVLPKSRGGKDTWENCVTACQPCNGKKGDKTPEEANLKLLKKPSRVKVEDDAKVWEMILSDEPAPLLNDEEDTSIEAAS